MGKKTGKLRDIFGGSVSFPTLILVSVAVSGPGSRVRELNGMITPTKQETTERESVGNYCECGSKAGN